MLYKNSGRVLINNFSCVWKQLLHFFAVFVAVMLLAYAFASPVVNTLKTAGWTGKCKELIETVYTSPKDLSTAFTNLMTIFFNLLRDNFSVLWPYYLSVIFVVIFVPLVITQMSVYVSSEVICAKMSSITKLGYLNTCFSKFWKSLSYAVVQILASVPFYAGYALAIFLYVLFAKNWLISIVLFPVLVLLFVFLFAFKTTIFSCFNGEVIYNKKRSTWTCFFKSIKKVNRRFGEILSNAVCLCLTIVILNVVTGICTLGAGLLVSVPASFVWLESFNLTTYFTDNKKRFYIAENTIVDPN